MQDLAFADRQAQRRRRLGEVGLQTFTVLSFGAPASLDVDTRSKVALAVMHLVVGASAVAGQAIARRSPSSDR